jgi:DNA-binding response OmpR family regulator
LAKILVVDDERFIRVTIEQCLTEAGHQVDLAVNGEHALQKAAEAEHDLVLLDMKLPDLDGLEVLRRMRKKAPDQAVVIITAYGTVATAVEAMKLGAIDYLQKPFTPEEIRNAVDTVLARAHITEGEAKESFTNSVEFAKGCISARHVAEAIPHLERAIALDPHSPEPYNLMGLVEEMRGELLEALKMYRAALAVDPSYRPAIENLERATDWRYQPPK